MTAPLDCRRCGACCINPPSNQSAEFPWWVEIAEGDEILARPELAKLVMHDADGIPHLRLAPNGRCVALRGVLGVQSTCSIYGERPTPCRTVEPGDSLCLRYRAEHGLA